MSEHAICSYFEGLGYKARRLGTELDAKKIDVVAENENEVIYAQVKLGSISEQEMAAVVESASALSRSESRDVLVAIVAGRYPLRSEFIRARLERKHRVRVLCISATEVIESNPEYRRTLGGNA